MHTRKSATAPLERLALSAQEAADLLGIGRSSLFKLVREGQLRGVKLGKRRVFTRTELEGLLERLSRKAG